MATETAKLKSVIAYNPTLVYEEQADGTRILRRIRVNARSYEVPADGVAIDVVPPDSVGTQQIKDDTVELHDLSPAAREATVNEFATDTEVKAALGITGTGE